MLIRNTLGSVAQEELIQRLLAWSGLRRAEKLGRLLTCLHENPDGPALTEKLIAAKLFPRPARHDVTDDSIVRVSVRQLRFKLQEYFAGEGAHEPWVTEIPKGEYVLRFTERVVEVEPHPEVAVPAQAAPSRRTWVWGSAALAVVAVGVGFGLGRVTAAGKADLPKNLLARTMESGKYSLTIIPGDALGRNLATYATAEPNLNEYLAGTVSPRRDLEESKAGSQLYRWLANARLVTEPHSANAAVLMGALGDLRTRAGMTHPRDVQVRALQQNSFVFLASRYMNPVVDLFEPGLTLRCDNDSPQRQIGVVDLLAKEGERKRYSASPDVSFGRVALVPNLGADGGRVLLLSGLGPVGTEAAALMASDPAWLSALQARLPRGQVYFEALVEAKAANDMPVDLRLLIVRPVSATAGRR